MENLSLYISLLFGATTFAAVFMFWKAASWSKPVIIIILAWLGLQAIIGLSGFYTVTDTMPPRFIMLLIIPVLFITGLFLTAKGKRFIDNLDLRWLTLLHAIRIPVELVLFALFINKLIPEIMTFEGRNLDILSGITAIIMYYLVFVRRKLNQKWLIAWNLFSLGLLINIVTIAVLSAPFPFQRFGFDQPNVAVLYFPFVWLPCCVVPLVFFSHLVAFRRLMYSKRNTSLEASLV